MGTGFFGSLGTQGAFLEGYLSFEGKGNFSKKKTFMARFGAIGKRVGKRNNRRCQKITGGISVKLKQPVPWIGKSFSSRFLLKKFLLLKIIHFLRFCQMLEHLLVEEKLLKCLPGYHFQVRYLTCFLLHHRYWLFLAFYIIRVHQIAVFKKW